PVALTILTIGHSELCLLLLGTLLGGFGTGISFGAMPVLLARQVQPRRGGSAVGCVAVTRTARNTLGAAIPGSIFAATASACAAPSDEGIVLAFGIGAGNGAAATVGIVVALLARRRPDASGGRVVAP